MPDPDNVPYLLSERHFRLYEPYIKAIVEAWPKPVCFKLTPPLTSLDTLATRIRLCNQALNANMQHTNLPVWQVDFDLPKFVQISDDICTSLTANPGTVTCGPANEIRKKAGINAQITEVGSPMPSLAAIRLSKGTPQEVVEAVMLLHHHRVLLEPSVIESETDLTPWTNTYDIAITKDGDIYTVV